MLEMVHFCTNNYTSPEMSNALNHLFLACCKSLQKEFDARLQEGTMMVCAY